MRVSPLGQCPGKGSSAFQFTPNPPQAMETRQLKGHLLLPPMHMEAQPLRGAAVTLMVRTLPGGAQEQVWPYLICISTLRLWRKCPAKARQSTGVSVA